MATNSIEIAPSAFAKILSHTIKYQHYSVNGLLLGSQNGDSILVQDTYPLFHTGHGLAPMLEIALVQLDTNFGNKLSIVGYYKAFENCKQQTPDLQCERIMDKLSEHFKQPFLLLVDNSALAKIKEEGSTLPLHIFNRQDGSLRLNVKTKLFSNEHYIIAREVIGKKLFDVCVDFDDHLEDIKLDWSNAKITGVIDSLFK